MDPETLLEMLAAIPGVYVDSWDIERTYGERTKLGLVITCDEQPTPYEIVVRVEPGDPPSAAFSLNACARCGRRGARRVLRSVPGRAKGGVAMSAEDYARNAERVEQARRLIDLLELAYRAQALDLQREVERQLALLLGLEMRR
jgi:hypothetical protein